MARKKRIEIWTDASVLKDGSGGWAYRLIARDGDHVVFRRDRSGGIDGNATAQQAEMVAIIAALSSINGSSNVVIYTDCKFVVDESKNRDNGEGSAFENLWQKIDLMTIRHKVEFQYVKAHIGIPHNEAVDTMAKEASRAVRDRKRRRNGSSRQEGKHE